MPSAKRLRAGDSEEPDPDGIRERKVCFQNQPTLGILRRTLFLGLKLQREHKSSYVSCNLVQLTRLTIRNHVHYHSAPRRPQNTSPYSPRTTSSSRCPFLAPSLPPTLMMMTMACYKALPSCWPRLQREGVFHFFRFKFKQVRTRTPIWK